MTGAEAIKRIFNRGVFKDFDHTLFIGLLEDFVPEVWAQYFVGGKSLIYVWYDGAEPLYVGQSKNWNGRCAAHVIHMLANTKDSMYVHFLEAHSAGRLSVTTRPCDVVDLDTAEAEQINALAHPGLYNKEHNPYNGRSRTVMPDLIGMLDTMEAVYRATLEKDPDYVANKDRLTYDGYGRAPYGNCKYCGEQKTYKRLLSHEATACEKRFSDAEVAAIRAEWEQSPMGNTAAWIKHKRSELNCTGAVLKALISESP